MYEVFFNERKIVIAQQGNIPFFKEAVSTENLNSVEEIKNWFTKFVSSKSAWAVLPHHSPEKFWKESFLPAFKPVSAAGGVVIRNNQLLFIYRSNKWDLPKGKIDSGETAEQAAIREVSEECGITGHQITKKLPSSFHIYQSPYKESFGQWILKETYWFEMNYEGFENGMPEIKENITEIRWFEIKQIDEVMANTYENLKPLISIYS